MAEPFFSPHWYRVAALRPRLRPHHDLRAHQYEGNTWYILRDHATNRVHRFSAIAFTIVGALDGKRSVEEIWLEAAAALKETAPSQDDVIRLLAHLHQQDMLQTDVPPDARDLLERLNRQRRALRAKTWKNPLSITIPLFDPDRWLSAIHRSVRHIPGWLLAVAWLALVVPAAALAVVHMDAIGAALSQDLLSAQNVLLMACIFPLTKMFHELAHGLAAKAFGASVHEFGVMLLVLYPAPYVDASSSQAIDNKWQRAMVGAAGIASDLVFAALAMHLWLIAEPGVLRALALNTMLICGASSLLVNGNPLLRFDAYFVLCDIFEKPNLGTRATRHVANLAERWLFGLRHAPQDVVSRREAWWYILYAPLAYVYRMALLLGIGLFVASEYLFVGVLVVLWTFVLSVVLPLGKIVKHLLSHPRLAERRGRAVLTSLALLGAALAGALVIPLPQFTTSEGVLWLPDEAHVRAGAPGVLTQVVAMPGAAVDVGDVLLVLEDPLLATTLRVQEGRVEEALARMNADRFSDQARYEIARQEHQAHVESLRLMRERQQRLTVRAGVAGTFQLPAAGDLPGRYFRQGDVIGHVITPSEGVVRVVVPQKDIDLVRMHLVDLSVRRADEPGGTLRARIVREVPGAVETLPSAVLSVAGGGPFVTDPRDPMLALERLFQLDLKLEEAPAHARFGTRMHVRFNFEPAPLLAQIGRHVRRLFLSRFNA